MSIAELIAAKKAMAILAIAAGDTLVDLDFEVDPTVVLEVEEEPELELVEVEIGEVNVVEVEAWTGEVEAETVECEDWAVRPED
jgi:hypothetical protein